jgi:mono/diheme cytochrome c family protein
VENGGLALISSKIPFFFMVACAVFFPIAATAQSRQASAKSAHTLNEQQFAGRGLFLQNCALCHLPEKWDQPNAFVFYGGASRAASEYNPKSTAVGPSVGPDLKGLFRGENAMPEQAVRGIIMRGFPNQMPGFRYGLEPKEIDSIIAYLKTL